MLMSRKRRAIVPGNFTFTIGSSANTSAGVYNASGVLIRTLWSLRPFNAGTFTSHWDGNDDFGNAATGSPYTIKILSSNTTYTWEGVIGNTSDQATGGTVLRAISQPACMAATSSFVYWALAYSEVWQSSWKTATSNLRSKTWIQAKTTGGAFENDFVCTDGTIVYWGCIDPELPQHSFVYGTLNATDAYAVFSSGVSLPQHNGPTYASVIDYVIDETGTWQNSQITGLAVQQTHDFLFISRAGIDSLHVINKTTGAVAQTLAITGAGRLVIDSNDDLWMAHGSVIEKYTVDPSTGAITTTGLTIALSNVGGLSVNPANTTIIAADMTAQQVKGYSTTTGVLSFTLGTGVSYTSSAAVQNNKFYWQDVRGSYTTFLCYLPDGTFLVGDGMNCRVQHFAADGSTFIDSFSYAGNQYSVWVDPNDPTRVFSQFLEFSVDYSQPLASSWALVNNWGGNYSAIYDNSTRLIYPITMSNGRTYAFVRNVNAKTVIELVTGGAIRYTSVTFANTTGQLEDRIDVDDAHMVLATTSGFSYGTQFTMKRFALTSFDGSNDPVWSASPSTTTTTPVLTSYGIKGNQSLVKTASGNLVHFDAFQSSTPVTSPTATGQGYHIGVIPEGGSDYKWGSAQDTDRDAYLGPYPGQGNYLGHWFDSGNGVHNPGGFFDAVDDHIMWSYHGENWKATQTNLYYHLYDGNIGLAVGSFGTNGLFFPLNANQIGASGGRVESMYGGAGNALQGQMCKVGSDIYLWHGDESYHGGIHRWKVNNVGSISVQTATYPSTVPIAPVSGMDLLAGLTRGGVFTDGVAGWNRSPAADFSDATGSMSTAIGSKNYDPVISPSLNMRGSVAVASGSVSATRDLVNSVALTTWRLSGDVLFDLNQISDNAFSNIMYQVLDNSGLIICQFYPFVVVPNNQVRFNGITIYSSSQNDLINIFRSWTELVVSYAGGVLTCAYGNYMPVTTTTPIDGSADKSKPSSLRLYIFTVPGLGLQATARQIALQNLRFDKTI